jgi:UDP-3-O-[3-hydroxymyristoyl] glucosamine N-acyltransferase
MAEKLGSIAKLLGIELTGNPDIEISGVATLIKAGKGDLTFYHNPKYAHELEQTKASAVIVPTDHPQLPDGVAALVTRDPYVAFAKAVALLVPAQKYPAGVHPLAFVAPSAKVAPTASLGPFVCVMDDATVGEGTTMLPYSTLGRGASLGRDCLLYPHVTIYHDCHIGDRAIIHAGTVIGSDGFGFAPSAQGITKFPQVGRVIVGNDVEMGANCSIDRGALDDTVLADGVKLDNQVHLAHNVHIGKNTMIAAQTGISGSTEIGEWCVFGGQVGLVGHLTVGDRVMFGAQSGVTKDCPADTLYFGTPAHELAEEKRRIAYIGRLEDMFKRIKELERKLAELTKKDDEQGGI